jgi:hypothetical protein
METFWLWGIDGFTFVLGRFLFSPFNGRLGLGLGSKLTRFCVSFWKIFVFASLELF